MLTLASVFTGEKKSLPVYRRERLLIVESNTGQQKQLCHILPGHLYEIQFAANALEGLTHVSAYHPDMVLLNLTLPGLNGFELCRRIRESSTAPILALVARENAADHITALDLGADDCLSIPFAPEELRARVQTLLQQSAGRNQPEMPTLLCVGELQIDFKALKLTRAGLAVYISPTEWKLLEMLAQHAGKIVSHDILHRAIWGDTDHKESSNLRCYIHRLRHKLEENPNQPQYLVSESGVGYVFLPDRHKTDNATVTAPLTRLPVPLTSFIGWAGEVERVKSLLQTPDVRLVSLIGPGGAGKTRLGLRVASQLVENFEHGVHFVALAPIRDAGLVAAAIVRALGVKKETGCSAVESLKTFLHGRKMLLLLDNFEQVLGAATLISDLLEMNDGLKVLVTSRSILHLYGEQEFEVPPLALPDLQNLSIHEVSQSPAVALFVERARTVQPDFNLTPHNVSAVAGLCVQLDGLPLAIELAAVRIKLFSPQAIAQRLSDRFTLLAGGGDNLPKRQQTMRNTINWSYDLLTLEEKTLFARLAIFEGGWTLDAAEAIVGTADVLTQLLSLLHKSMLVRCMVGEEVRFHMLETVREYAREHLNSSAEAELLRERHLNYYLKLAQIAQPELENAQSQVWLERLDQEHDNLRAALQWALERENQRDTAVTLAATLGIFWKNRGYWSEGRRWLNAALAHGGNASPLVRAQALREAAWLALVQGDYIQAEKFLGMAHELWGGLEDDPNFTCMMGLILDGQGKYEQARALLASRLESYRQLGDRKSSAFSLHLLGQIAMKHANYALAQHYMQACLALRYELGIQPDIARSLLTLGHIMRLQGNDEQAGEYYRESLAIFEQVNLKWGIAHCLLNLGKIACAQKAYEEARSFYQKTLKIFEELGDRYSMACNLEAQASLAAEQMQIERAARLWGAAQALRKELNTPMPPADYSQFEAQVKNIWENLAVSAQSDAKFSAAWEAGGAMLLADLVAYARQ